MFLRQDGPRLVVETPAKLNLCLSLLAKRADGFHELETLMVSTDLYDTLAFGELPQSEIRLIIVPGRLAAPAMPALTADGDNLVVKAAYLIQHETGCARGAEIVLRKRIPMQAGLGGGSSDAAATLVGLNRLWNLGLTSGDLHRLAAQLGSDVNFFIDSTPAAICTGRGEIVRPVAIGQGLFFVVAHPGVGLSTADVFRNCEPAGQPGQADRLVDYLSQSHLRAAARAMNNDLEPTALELSAEVRQLKEWFAGQPGLGSLMSGSGTSYFALCTHRDQARTVAARLRAERKYCSFVVQCHA